MDCASNIVAASHPARRDVPGTSWLPPSRTLGLPTKVSKSSMPQVHTPKNLGNAQKSVKVALRDQMVLMHLPLVKVIALRMRQRLPAYVDLEDMVQAGSLGLFSAASKYDTAKQVVFSSYAKHRIKGAILDSLRQLDWASRDMRRRYKQVEAAKHELTTTLGRAPLEAEVAGRLGIDLKRLGALTIDVDGVRLVSASTRSSKDETLPAPDFPDKAERQPDSIYERAELRSTLRDVAKTLPERHQRIFRLYYNDEMSMMEIGAILGINESRVSQIHKVALAKMAKVFETMGITSSQAFLGGTSCEPRPGRRES